MDFFNPDLEAGKGVRFEKEKNELVYKKEREDEDAKENKRELRRQGAGWSVRSRSRRH